ncbi:MAG: proline--tRNA ligase, partial [Clostridiales bacterium]|nr:proline--tRNA ligase [Clostridiales bacterium]
ADTAEMLEVEKIHTPDVKTIEELMSYMNCEPSAFVKTILYNIDGRIVAAMVRGDRDINETKLGNLYDATEMDLASFADVEEITGAKVGFAGPVGLKKPIDVIVDLEVASMKNFIVGACETDYHFKNINIGRDFEATKIVDIRNLIEGDKCPKCGSPIKMARGVEVGHIFKLGTKYSKALNCVYLDKDGKENTMVMGCYGIGVGRTLAAIIEQYNDEDGIKWPAEIAPYKAIVVPTKVNDEENMALAEKIYKDLQDKGVEVMIDDRNERPGVKFKDADLIGIPVRITVGRRANEGVVEVKYRMTGEMKEMTAEEAVSAVLDI